MRRLIVGLAGVLVAVIFVGKTSAAIETVPIGLNPGDQYRLIFTTSTTRNAASTDINDYNTHVQNAIQALSPSHDLYKIASIDSWRAIGSTATVNARTNTGTNWTSGDLGVPIFLISDSIKFADDYADLWDTGYRPATPNVTELGTSPAGERVWTGTSPNGNSNFYYLGKISSVRYGLNTSTGSWQSAGRKSNSRNYHLYGLSPVLTVPSEVIPEPSTLVIWSLLAAAGGVGAWRRRRKR